MVVILTEWRAHAMVVKKKIAVVRSTLTQHMPTRDPYIVSNWQSAV